MFLLLLLKMKHYDSHDRKLNWKNNKLQSIQKAILTYVLEDLCKQLRVG